MAKIVLHDVVKSGTVVEAPCSAAKCNPVFSTFQQSKCVAVTYAV